MIWVAVKIMAPFWGSLNIRCRIMIGIQKGTIILTTTHIEIVFPYSLITCRKEGGIQGGCKVSSVHSSGDNTTQGQETLPPASVRSCRAKGGAPSDLPGAKP